MKFISHFTLLIFFILGFQTLSSQNKELTTADLQFPREKMQFEDQQLILFNGRGYVCPRQHSMTNFCNVHLFPIELNYNFYLNFLETSTQTIIQDDVAINWPKWTNEGLGWDPLAANFRPYAPKVMVTQDEMWQPNLSTRTGIFNKEIEKQWISFSMKTGTCMSATEDEVLMWVEIYNREAKNLDLVMMPHQEVAKLPFQGQTGSDEIKLSTPFEIASDQLQVTVSSDIVERTDKGFAVNIPAKSSKRFYFAVQFLPGKAPRPAVYQADIQQRFQQAQDKTAEILKWASNKLPSFTSENKQMNDLYNRCLLSVLMCRYERENYIIKPFWAVGTWPFTISWDNSYSSDVLALLEPESLKETLRLNFTEGKMKRTYIGWSGAAWDMLYIQEPFAQQIMIDAYMNQTGDTSILSEMAGDASIYGWMKRWAHELHDKYGRKDGLIDIGYSTEKIIEIRTDGYNHVVPIVNALTLDLYRRLVQWGEMQKDKDAIKFAKWGDQLQQSIDQQLWNEEKGWFDNLYPDGSKSAVWTYHLFDLLGSPNLDNGKRLRLMSHIKDGVFLGEYGFYSIARNDSLHWDRIDGDWGGGGQYAGMPFRIARYLYQAGNSALAFDVLKRTSNYTKFFPYITQNASTDKPHQEMSSMPLEISAGAGVEAIIFGTFGIKPTINGLTICPHFHQELGKASLKAYCYRGDLYDIELNHQKYKVFKNSELFAELAYGQTCVVK